MALADPGFYSFLPCISVSFRASKDHLCEFACLQEPYNEYLDEYLGECLGEYLDEYLDEYLEIRLLRSRNLPLGVNASTICLSSRR